MAIGPKDDIEGVSQSRIRLVVLDEDRFEGVLPLRIRRAGEAQHLRRVLPGIGHVQIAVRPEGEAAQLAQLESVRERVSVERLAQRLPTQVEDVDVVPLVRVIATMEGDVPAPHAIAPSCRRLDDAEQ
jgi:hypothetical protein